jgi:hypothetical protein
MTLKDLIRILENKVAYLGQQKGSAAAAGDVEQVLKLEQDEASTSLLVSQLRQVAENSE